MDNMADGDVRQLQKDVATLRGKVESLEQNRFGVLEAKLDATRDLLEHNDKTVRTLFGEQSKRMDRTDTRMDRLEGTIERVGTRLTVYLAAATAVIGVVQYLTR